MFESLFADKFIKTAVDLLLEYHLIDDIIQSSLEDLTAFIIKFGKNRFADSEAIATKIKAAARASYRLDKTAYDPINLSLASSINVMNCYDAEIEEIDKTIIHHVAGFNQNHCDVLLSITGICKVTPRVS